MQGELLRFFGDVASHLTASFVERSFTALRRANLLSVRALHRRDLLEKVKDMPFIYRDLEGDLVNDFVDPDLKGLEIQSLAFSGESCEGVDERIRQRKRILVLGNAGIGKTTFLRYEILLLLQNKGRVRRYFEKENLLPFYVPLKAVDNSQPYPILRYLIANNLYLRKGGVKRLTVLGQRRELFLFLDGYDEIDAGTRLSAHPSQNFISAELLLLLQPAALKEAGRMPSEYRAFYEAAQRCRLWLSSRREFFLLNPVQLEDLGLDTRRFSAAKGVKEAFAIHLAGVGHNRHQLADKIFDKYRRRSTRYDEVLSAEYFLQEIDHSTDRELVDLSYNPLFLTVMAYIYAEKAMRLGSYDVKLGDTLSGLILECISLLLIDLDKEKARGLSEAHRAALLRRRCDFVDEKREFLVYLASRLLYEGRNLFDLAYLRRQAIHFFSNEHKGENGGVILRELQSPIGSSADIVMQLIYAGLFVLVDRSTDGTNTYDFPHRRFREVLASQYFDALGDRTAAVERCIGRRDLTETLYVFFSISRFKDEIVRAILARVQRSAESRIGDILLHCLEQASGLYSASEILEEFFLRAMREGTVFVLPIEIMDHVKSGLELSAKLTERLYPALIGGDISAASLACALLARLDRSSLLRTLLRAVKDDVKDRFSAYLMFFYLWDLDRDYCIKHAAELTNSPVMAAGFYLAFANRLKMLSNALTACEDLVRNLPLGRNVALLVMVDSQNDRIIPQMTEKRLLSKKLESLVAVARSSRDGAGNQYVITHEDLESLPAELQKPFSTRIGKVHSQKEMDELTEGKPGYARFLEATCISESLWESAAGVRKVGEEVVPQIHQFFRD